MTETWRTGLQRAVSELREAECKHLQWLLTEAALQECIGTLRGIEQTESWPKGSGYDYALTDNSGEVTRERLNALSYRLGDLPVRCETDSFGDDVCLNVVVRWPS